MKILITGTASGIGKATAEKFLHNGHVVYGMDVKESKINHSNYQHIICDVGEDELPEIEGINILVDNAGVEGDARAIQTNLVGYLRVAEKYAFQDEIKSVVIVASIAGHTGLDTPYYSASQGGRLAYAKNLALRLGKRYRATVNSISPGAVLTNLEPLLYCDAKLVEAVAKENILKKWATSEEIAEFIYFLSVVNKSMTGQDIIVDNGENANYNFVDWREK